MEYCNCEEMNYSWGSIYVNCYTYVNCIIGTREKQRKRVWIVPVVACRHVLRIWTSPHTLCVSTCLLVMLVCVYFPREDFGLSFHPVYTHFCRNLSTLANRIESSCKMSDVLRVSVWGLFVWMLLVCSIVFWNSFFPWWTRNKWRKGE